MNTIPSHLLINAAIERKFGAKFQLANSAFLWGSVTPDIPLGLLSVGSYVYFRYFAGQTPESFMPRVFGELYFHDPLWIAGHNFLHSPTALILYAALLWRFVGKPGTHGHAWLSFVFGCLVHSVIDILTHHDDGPVLFWPFDWQTRFYSPISYWDKAHFGREFFWFELGLNLVLLGYILLPWLIQKLKKLTNPYK